MLQEAIIIGSGPAGWTAALYLARARVKVTIFTGFAIGGVKGGQLTTTTEVENFPGFPLSITGPELMLAMEAQVKNYDVNIIEEDVLEVDLSARPFTVKGTNTCMQAHSLIICTGAYARRLDDVPGDQALWGLGISACAVCDGALPFFRDKELAVIGGGDSACEEALFLTKYAKKVHMVLRRDVFRASKIMAERVMKHEKIEIIFNHEVQEIRGEKFVESLLLKEKNTLEVRTLPVQGVFYALGHKPGTPFLQNQLKLDDEGFIVKVDETTRTSVDGIFAAGDVCDRRYKQAVTAAGEGCKAALDCERWLSEQKG